MKKEVAAREEREGNITVLYLSAMFCHRQPAATPSPRSMTMNSCSPIPLFVPFTFFFLSKSNPSP